MTIRQAEPADAGVVTDFNLRLAEETENLRLDPADAKTPAQPLELSVQSVQVAGGKLHLLDRSPAKPYKVVLQNITADVKQLSTAENARATVKAGFDTDAGGRFDYEGSAQLRPVAADGRVSLTGFRLGALYPYYESALNLEIADGSLDADSRFELALDPGGLDLRTSGGTATITKLRARFPGDKEPLIVAPRLSLKDAALDLRKRSIAIGEASGRDASIWLRRDPDGRLHVARLFKAAADVAAAPAGEKASLWQWQAGQIRSTTAPSTSRTSPPRHR